VLDALLAIDKSALELPSKEGSTALQVRCSPTPAAQRMRRRVLSGRCRRAVSQ
jgi:hypothetical protein